MQIGFLTNIFAWDGLKEFDPVLQFAADNGFPYIELGPTYPLSADILEKVYAKGVSVCGLIYCRNLLSDDREAAQQHKQEVLKRIDFAADFDIPLVTISAGIVQTQLSEVYDEYEAIRPLPKRSLDAFEKVYSPVIEHAENKGVRLGIEICPLMGNWAISPALWTTLFERVSSSNLGLTYDPSHLLWQFIDPYAPLEQFADRIFHVHAKDTEVDCELLRQKGILSDFSWWQARIPGWGDLNWRKILFLLKKIGYRGAVSIEHEDPFFRGSIEKVKKGILLSRDYLQTTAGLV